MKITIIENEKPKMPQCKMLCDQGLNEKLERYELTKFLNQHSTTLFIGKPRSGKTSLLFSLMKGIMKKCFHKIYVFQPAESRASMSNDIFGKLPNNQIYSELSNENLNEVMSLIRTDASNGLNSLIIFDDQTAHLKKKDTLNLFKELIYNRRHLHVSLYFCVQTYYSVPKDLRRLWTNLFIFKTSKSELVNIWNELIEYDDALLVKIRKMVYDKPYQYLFVNTDSQRLFKQFDEIKIYDEDEDEDLESCSCSS
jgi:hypothetical protein